MLKNAILSRVFIAIAGAFAGMIATEYPVIAQGVCFDIINALELQGEDIIKSLDALPVFPETYYQSIIEELE